MAVEGVRNLRRYGRSPQVGMKSTSVAYSENVTNGSTPHRSRAAPTRARVPIEICMELGALGITYSHGTRFMLILYRVVRERRNVFLTLPSINTFVLVK